MKKINLSCNILGTEFSSFVWLGSGSLTEKNEDVCKFLSSGVGAIIPRTTRLKYATGRHQHPSFHLHINQEEKWMRNCEWTGDTIKYWIPYLKELAETRKVIMSVSGREINDCVEVCKILDRFNFPFLEINISCSHSNEAHGFITRNSEHIATLIKKLKENIKTPIALKLGHSDFIVHLAKMAEKAGVDAIVAINTYGPVLDFDIENGEPELLLGTKNGKGGLSGKSIFHIALTDIADLARVLKIPIIASGGITEPKDAIKMIMAGASAVQIYSAAHIAGANAPKFLDKFVSDLEVWMTAHSYINISQIKGMLLNKLKRDVQMKIRTPDLNSNLCKKCGTCVDICLKKAIDLGSECIEIDKNKCIGCGACVFVCPSKALK